MVIDVVVFTPSAPVWHIQGHLLHVYIMGDAVSVKTKVSGLRCSAKGGIGGRKILPQ